MNSITKYLAVLDQETAAKLAEMEFLVADLERANSRVAAVERRNVWLFF